MRRSFVAVLVVIEALVACAIMACSLQLSHRIARNETLGNVATGLLRSTHSIAQTTRRIAESGVRVRFQNRQSVSSWNNSVDALDVIYFKRGGSSAS